MTLGCDPGLYRGREAVGGQAEIIALRPDPFHAPVNTTADNERWATTWAASMQGPYPVGNPSAQPDLAFAFPVPEAGARDQSFRLIVRPDAWGRQARLRFTNVLGTTAVTFDDVYCGLHLDSG